MQFYCTKPCSDYPPEGEHSEGTVGLVTRGVGEASTPKVIVKQVAERRVPSDVIVVDNCFRIIKNKVPKQGIYKADAGTQAYQQGCYQVWQL